MNQREPTSVPIGAGQALPCLALLLLPLLTAAQGWARPALSAPPAFSAKPYLVAVGSPPLRFEEPAPPPDLVTRPPAGAPPQPLIEEPQTSSDAPESPSDSSSAANSPASPMSAASQPTATLDEPNDEPNSSTPDVSEPVRPATPILRDDIRPQARPEDFLPFFRIPAPGSDATVIVPAPRTPSGTPLPPSSAIYTQSP